AERAEHQSEDRCGHRLLRQELTRDRVLAELHPVRRSRLAEDLDLRIDEEMIREDVSARLRAGVALRSTDHDWGRGGAGPELVGARRGAADEHGAPLFRV